MNLFETLQQYKKDGKVLINSHPQKDLYIVNYSPKIQFSGKWDELLIKCRGLVLNSQGKILATPFKKFFNWQEHVNKNYLENIPSNESFEVWEKLDGSMIILFWDGTEWEIASRGSFASDHAKKAKKLFKKYRFKNNDDFNLQFDKKFTYVFELISPEFRIVVDYGDLEALFSLAIVETNTYVELNIDNFNWPHKPRKFDGIKNFEDVLNLPYDKTEGFVIRFESGMRVKVKFDEYVKLHKVFTGVNNVAIWELLKNGKNVKDIIDDLPDELYGWIKKEKEKLEKKFNKLKKWSNDIWSIKPSFNTRKDLALWIKKQKYPQLLFPLIDGKNNDEIIWKMIKPKNK